MTEGEVKEFLDFLAEMIAQAYVADRPELFEGNRNKDNAE